MSEIRMKENTYRRQRELQRHIFISIFTICITVMLALSIFSIRSDAKDGSEAIEMKYYTSIEVTSGDTLWTIATDHMGMHYDSETDYIKEVMQMNALHNDTIYAGQHLVIPYYSSQILE